MTLRDKLHQLLEALPEERASIHLMIEGLGRDAFIFIALVLTLPFLAPVSIPGISTVFGALIALIGLSLMLNRDPWLPERYLHRELPAARLRVALKTGAAWLHRLEKISRPRWTALVNSASMKRINGFMVLLGAILLMAPFGFVPLTNTLPGLAILFLCIGMLQQDGRSIALGYATNLLTLFYFAVILSAGTAAVNAGLQSIGRWINL